MTQLTELVVFQEARELIRLIQPITEHVRFGDLSHQLRRSTVSVASNICEGMARPIRLKAKISQHCSGLRPMRRMGSC